MKKHTRFVFLTVILLSALAASLSSQTIDKNAAKILRSFEVVDFSGAASDEISIGGFWRFTGPTREITVAAGQRIVGAGAGVFGTTSGTSRLAVSLCYQRKGSDEISSLAENNHLIADADASRRTFAVTVSSELPAGTYSFGYCVNNRGPQVLNNNDYVNGWLIVVK